jgi:hypothetical protein
LIRIRSTDAEARRLEQAFPRATDRKLLDRLADLRRSSRLSLCCFLTVRGLVRR